MSQTSGSLTRSRLRLHRVETYVDANLHNRLTLSSVAKAMGVSESSIQRVLQQDKGVRFKDYLRCARVRRALDLIMTDPWAKVDYLTIAVGWRSRKTLYQSVRKITGASLSSLRADLSSPAEIGHTS